MISRVILRKWQINLWALNWKLLFSTNFSFIRGYLYICLVYKFLKKLLSRLHKCQVVCYQYVSHTPKAERMRENTVFKGFLCVFPSPPFFYKRIRGVYCFYIWVMRTIKIPGCFWKQYTNSSYKIMAIILVTLNLRLLVCIYLYFFNVNHAGRGFTIFANYRFWF